MQTKKFGLYYPIPLRPMRPEEFTKYIEICEKQAETGDPTAPELVEEIRRVFYETHEKVKRECLDEWWGYAGGRLIKNAGLAQLILDYNGAASDFLFPFLKAMQDSPATALEMSRGAGYDMEGNWVDNIPETDPIWSYIYGDPPFAYNRERQEYVASLVANLLMLARLARSDKNYNGPGKEFANRKIKVVDLGAGWVAWARWHNLDLDPELIEIVASDMDTSIVPEKLFPDGLEKSGITYTHADLRARFTAPECQGADLVIFGGVASYYPPEARAKFAAAVYNMLNPSGTFFFDLQVLGMHLKRSMGVFGWPPMYLQDSAAETIAAVEGIRKELWKSDLKYRASYTMDTYNELPTAVMVELKKL